MELYLGTVIAGTVVAAVVCVVADRKQKKLRAELMDTYREWLEDHSVDGMRSRK